VITRRGGFLIIFGVSLELFALSFYAIRDFASFLKDLMGVDLRVFLPNIYGLIYLSPALILISTLVLTSVVISFTNYHFFTKLEFIEVRRKLSTNRCFAGDFVTVTITLDNKSRFWINNVFISDIIPDTFDLVLGENFIATSLPPKSSIEFSYIVRCSVRGIYKIGPIQIVLQDRAGLFLKNYLVENYSDIVVYPSYEDVKRLEFLQKAYGSLLFGRYRVREKGHGYDFWGLRKYIPGDSVKSVDWKASARAGTLFVREYEAEKNIKMYIFVDASSSMSAGMARMTKLDYVARATVLLSYLANRSRDFFGLVVFSDGIKEYIPAGRGRMHFYKIMETLSKIDAEGPSNLSRAMKEFIMREKRASLAIVLSDLEGDPTMIEEAVKIALSHKVNVIFIAPIGPLFEKIYTEELSRAFFEVALMEYMKRREQIKYRLAKYGVHVLDVGPEDLVAIALETFLKAKARGIGMM